MQGPIIGMPHLVARTANCGLIVEKTWPCGDKSDHEALFSYLIDWMRMHLAVNNPSPSGIAFSMGVRVWPRQSS